VETTTGSSGPPLRRREKDSDVIGHAPMAFTRGYLRGLEVCELSTDSMPNLFERFE
jgi:hypothetical protein